MHLRKIVISTICILFSLCLWAQNSIKHQVAKGETLYKIALKYNVTIDDIKAANPTISQSSLNVGNTINIPNKSKNTTQVAIKMDSNPILPNEKIDLSKVKNKTTADKKTQNAQQQTVKDNAVTTKATATQQTTIKTLSDTSTAPAPKKAQPKPIKHKVGADETLYSIAKMYNQNINLLQDWNKLSDNSVKSGQDIIVDWVTPSGEALVKVANKSAVVVAPNNTKALSPFERKYHTIEKDTTGMYRKVTQTGIATWFDDAGTSASAGGNMYALHRTAPLRTILKVRNPMNNKSTYVMVFERLPNTINNENVSMSLTKSAAKKLGILDEKSIVECKYYVLK